MVLVSVMQYHKSNNVRYRNAGQTRYESVLSWEDQLFIQRQRQNAAVLLSLLELQQEVGLQRLPALKDNKRACGWNRWKSIDSPKSTSVEPLNIQAASKIVGLNFWTVPFTEIAIKKKKKKKLHCVFSEGFHIHASQSSKSTVALKQSVFSQFRGHGERKAAEVGLRHQTPPLDLLGLLKLLLWTPGGRYECFCLKQLCPVYCWRFASHWACVSVCAFIYIYICVCVLYLYVGGQDCPAQTAEGSHRGHSGLVYLRRLALIVPEGRGGESIGLGSFGHMLGLRHHRGHLLTFSAQLGIYVILAQDGYHQWKKKMLQSSFTHSIRRSK